MSRKINDNQSTIRIFMRNFLHNPSGVIGLTIISVLIISSLFAVQISGVEPDYIDPINSRLFFFNANTKFLPKKGIYDFKKAKKSKKRLGQSGH